MMVAVTNWPFDLGSIAKRQQACDFYGEMSEYCHNQEWFKREFTQEISKKLGIKR